MARKLRAPIDVTEARRLVEREFENASDRAAAIVGAAILDEQLIDTLRDFFVVDEVNDSKLFEGVGQLSAFASKIDLAYRLGLISAEEKRRLNFVRDIRNSFAHKISAVSFSDPEIANKCRDFQIPVELVTPAFPDGLEKIPTDVPPLTKAGTDEPRSLFQEVVLHLSEALSTRRLGARMEARDERASFSLWTEVPAQTMVYTRQLLSSIEGTLAGLPASHPFRPRTEQLRAQLVHAIKIGDVMVDLGQQSLSEWHSKQEPKLK